MGASDVQRVRPGSAWPRAPGCEPQGAATGWQRSRPVISLPYSKMPDEDLMAASARGDRHAFDEIIVRHGPFALRIAARVVVNAAVAEDLVQDAMVRAWTQAARFDPTRAKLTTWLYRIVVNLCIDHRRRTHMEPLPDDFDPVDPAAGADDVLAERQRTSALVRAVDKLPPHYRAAVSLVYDEGLSGAEAARVMGKSPKALERMLSRAVIALRGALLSGTNT